MTVTARTRTPSATAATITSRRLTSWLVDWRATSAATSTAPTASSSTDAILRCDHQDPAQVILRRVSRSSARTAHIVVDMTPLEPLGQNGGAGLVATTLVRHLAALAPEFDITLLTARASHDELAALVAPNVRRQCIVDAPSGRSVA